MVEVLERAQDINVEMKVGDAIADPLLRQRSSYREGRAMHIVSHCAALFNEFQEIVGSDYSYFLFIMYNKLLTLFTRSQHETVHNDCQKVD